MVHIHVYIIELSRICSAKPSPETVMTHCQLDFRTKFSKFLPHYIFSIQGMNLKMSLHHNGLVLSTQCLYEFLTTYNRDSHNVSINPIYFPMMQTNGFCYALYRFASIIGSHSMVRFLSNSFRSLHQNYGHNATDPTAMQKYCGAYW